MSELGVWRDMSPEETALIADIVSRSNVPGAIAVVDELDGALVSHSTQWILDIRPMTRGRGVDLSDGPFPARAYVPGRADYRGEIIVWIKDGHLNGLEYAWTTDAPPVRWPRPDDVEVVRTKPAEYDVVRLRVALPEYHLGIGAKGTVVMDFSSYSDSGLPPAYEVEFIDTTGATTALVTVAEADLEVVHPAR